MAKSYYAQAESSLGEIEGPDGHAVCSALLAIADELGAIRRLLEVALLPAETGDRLADVAGQPVTIQIVDTDQKIVGTLHGTVSTDAQNTADQVRITPAMVDTAIMTRHEQADQYAGGSVHDARD